MKRWIEGLVFAALVGITACSHGEDPPTGAPACVPATPHDARSETREDGFVDGCGAIEITYEKRRPTVALLIDQSGSMAMTDFVPTRYGAVRNALVGPDGVLPTVDCDVRLGATLYHSNEGNLHGDACPLLTSTPLPFVIDDAAAIATLLDENIPIGQTPTAESIKAVADQLVADPDPGPKFIVLATDGEPDTCDVPEPKEGQLEAIIATQTAFNQGIRTYIISVGLDVTDAFLGQMANAGAGLPLDTVNAGEVTRATDAPGLQTIFQNIIYGIRSCFVTLDDSIKNPSKGLVTLDGGTLYVDTDWRIDGDHELELIGDACSRFRSGQELRVVYQCGDVVPR
jgi:hypothetical protein